ncbi:MAG: CehA/McbA family metallohydrolase [bacterium]
MTVIKKKFNVVRDDMQTIKEIRFDVSREVKEIIVKGDYSPGKQKDKAQNKRLAIPAIKKYAGDYIQNKKQLEKEAEEMSPLRNLVRYTLFAPQGEHRAQAINFFQPTQINNQYVSPGCKKGTIKTGVWKLFLEFHAIVTDKLQVELEIELNEKITDPLEVTQKAILEKKQITGQVRSDLKKRQKETEKKWYGGDLHVHSFHSDGHNSVVELIEFFQEKNVDFFVLSDHNTTAGWCEELLQYMPVIPGSEITSFYGHFVAVNQKNYIDWYALDSESEFEDMIEKINTSGGLFSLAHYGSIGNPVCTGCRWEYDRINWEYVNFMEVGLDPSGNKRIESLSSLAKWEELLNRGYKISAVSGSDLHNIDENIKEKEMPLTYVRADSPEVEEIIGGLKQGKIYISCGLEMGFTVNDKQDNTYTMGEEIRVKNKDKINLEFVAKGLPENAVLEIVKKGEVIKKENKGPNLCGNYSLEISGQDQWLNLRVKNKDGGLVALTNPVYISSL